jgi:co-chaperonin GroES (HSP10)
MKKYDVTGHFVAIIPDEVEKVSKGGIVLAEDFDTNKSARVEAASTVGTVVGIGAMAWKAYDGDDPDWKPWAKIGDSVVFVRHVAKIYEDKDDLDTEGNPRKVFILADENIIMILDKAKTNLEAVV